MIVDGRDVTDDIRTPEIAALTSRLSTLAIVRDKLTPMQRRLAATGGVVLEGRDTGTVVCPDAEVKFYLDASLEERARRRQAELRARGVELESEAARREIAARDTQDSSRALAPLRKAPDADRGRHAPGSAWSRWWRSWPTPSSAGGGPGLRVACCTRR